MTFSTIARSSLVLLALVAVSVTFTACSNCGGTKGNCDVGWDFYDECDLVEGRERMCATNDPCGQGPCGPAPCSPGVPSTTCNPCGTVSPVSPAPCAPPLSAPAPAPVIIEESVVEDVTGTMPTPMPAPIVRGEMPPAGPLDIDPLTVGN